MNTTKQLDMRHTTKQPLNNMFSGRPAGFFLTKISVFMCKDYSFIFLLCFFVFALSLFFFFVESVLLCGECPPTKKSLPSYSLGLPGQILLKQLSLLAGGSARHLGPPSGVQHRNSRCVEHVIHWTVQSCVWLCVAVCGCVWLCVAE